MYRLEPNNDDPILLPHDLPIVIGRGDQCDVPLDDPSVSRMHCQFIATDGRVTLTDRGSRWGTLVNGQKVKQCDLRPGDQITVGETILTLEVEGDANRTTLARRSELTRPEGISLPSVPLSDVEASVDQVVPDDADSQPDLRVLQLLQPNDFLGQTFHRYLVQQTIARTPNGIVFRAKEGPNGRPFALKMFQPSFFADGVAEQRFQRAARTMYGQRHPNIIELYNAGKKDGYCFTASQLVEGESAVDLIQRIGVAGMVDPSTVLQIAVDLCEALRFAESKDIVHRNIKPSNILIRDSDHAALLNDLILAKACTASGAEQLTQAGDVLGDISYMSPEQLGSGHPVDCRSDIYQLGATLYALLTGRPPFGGGTFADTIKEVLVAKPKPVQDWHMATPAQFDTVVLMMLEKNPADRIQTADELAVALRKVAAETGQRDIKSRMLAPKATGWSGALDGLL